MDVPSLPRHLVILGGSYIGLEFAQMFRRFGSEVTVIERGPRIASREDPDVSAEIPEDPVLEGEGVSIRVGTEATKVTPAGDGLEVVAGGEAIAASHLLVAIGRAPAVGGPSTPRSRRRSSSRRAAATSASTTSCAPPRPTSTRSAT